MAVVEISGNLGKTPELRYTKDGQPWVCLNIAENHRGGGRQWTDWWDAVIFGTLAVRAAEVLETGVRVSVKGRIAVKLEEYEGKRMVRRTVYVEMLGFHGTAKAKAGTDTSREEVNDGQADAAAV
jgi:single-stranded DNA-binding protein